jgi:chemotaxis response regulator CheB
MKKYDAIVLGTSAGGINTLPKVINGLDKNYPLPLIIVQHTVVENDFDFYIDFLKSFCIKSPTIL